MPAEVAERRRGPRDVEVPAVADRMAGVERLERGQLVGVAPRSGRPAEGAVDRARTPASAPTPGNAAAAAATARSTSAGPAWATSAMTDPSCGSIVANVAPSSGVDELAVDEQAVLDAHLGAGHEGHRRADGAGGRSGAQISTGTDGSWPLEMRAGSSGSAFSQTRSIARFGA